MDTLRVGGKRCMKSMSFKIVIIIFCQIYNILFENVVVSVIRFKF